MTLRKTASLFQKVEHLLSSFYDFPLTVNSFEYLMREVPSAQRAAVLFQYDEAEDALDIGLAIHADIIAAVEQDNPLIHLHDGNLDPFFVVVEELSHFHLLVNRASSKQPLSQLELEWQGEIDKILIGACFLFNQQRDPHWEALMHRLFDTSRTVVELNKYRYEEASRLAARFWRELVQAGICEHKDPQHSKELRSHLRKKYWETWQAKVSQLELRKLLRSS